MQKSVIMCNYFEIHAIKARVGAKGDHSGAINFQTDAIILFCTLHYSMTNEK